MNKKCTKCGETKPATTEYFCFSSHIKCGLSPRCKECDKQYRNMNTERAREYNKKYREENHKTILKEKKKYYWEHRSHNLERSKEYYKNNRDALCQHAKEYAQTNKKHISRYQEIYRKNNLPRLRKAKTKWKQKNKTQTLVDSQKRLARRRSLPATLTIKQWESILINFDNKCAYCGKTEKLQQDHFIPLVRGGEYTHNNIIPACSWCNQHKNDKDFFAWYPNQKFYSKKREKKILAFLNYKNGKQQLSIDL